MTDWRAIKAKHLLITLQQIGWAVKRQTGSHKVLSRTGWPDVIFAFYDHEEICPCMLVRVAKNTGLKPEDL